MRTIKCGKSGVYYVRVSNNTHTMDEWKYAPTIKDARKIAKEYTKATGQTSTIVQCREVIRKA